MDVLEAARSVLGEIDLDPATNPPAQQRVRARQFFTKADNGLVQLWRGRVWLNPPFSFPLIEQFVQKLVEEYRAGNVTAAIMLTNSRTDAKWFHAAFNAAAATCAWRGRILFLRPSGESGASPTHAQLLFYFGPDVECFERVFGAYGTIQVCRLRGEPANGTPTKDSVSVVEDEPSAESSHAERQVEP